MKKIAKYLLSLDEPTRKRTLELMANPDLLSTQRKVCVGAAPTTQPTPYGQWECDESTGTYLWIAAIGRSNG